MWIPILTQFNSIHVYNGSRELTFTIEDTTSDNQSGFSKTWNPPHEYGMHLLTIHPEMIVTKVKVVWSDNKSSFGLNVKNAYNAQEYYATALDYTGGGVPAGESYHEIDFQKGRILYKMSEATEPFVQEVHPLKTIQITDIPLRLINTVAQPAVLTTKTPTKTTVDLEWTDTPDFDIKTDEYPYRTEPRWVGAVGFSVPARPPTYCMPATPALLPEPPAPPAVVVPFCPFPDPEPSVPSKTPGIPPAPPLPVSAAPPPPPAMTIHVSVEALNPVPPPPPPPCLA
jgi:hypothetical protein